MLSKTCIYGIRATLYVATQNTDKYLPINQIADALDISFHFLTKILQLLTQKDIMKSYRGPNGGIALAKAPEDIFISDIIKAIDGDDLFKECILGLPGCGELKPCPMHDEWGNIRAQITYMFSKTSVKEMAERIVRDNLRISDINWKDMQK